MKRLSGYPNEFYWAQIFATLAVWLSGLWLLPSALEFKLQYEVDWALPLETRLPAVISHVVAAFFLLFLLGALWFGHMRAGWRKRLNRTSGAALAVMFAVLAGTGVALYYAGSETGQLFNSVVHSVVGMALLLIFVVHMLLGRRIRKRRAHH